MILIILQSNKIPIAISDQGYAAKVNNPGGYRVIASESNATVFKVKYPDEYVEYAKTVDMFNSKGEYTQLHLTSDIFSLDSRMTFAGYTSLFFYATSGNKVVKWDVVKVKIWSTDVNYVEIARASTDVLKKASADSEKALHIANSTIDECAEVKAVSAQAAQKAIMAESYSAQALAKATQAEVVSLQSNANSLKAMQSAREAVELLNGIRSPVTGLVGSLQATIDDMFADFTNGIMAGQFGGLNITAMEYDGKNISAYNFDKKSKIILIGE